MSASTLPRWGMAVNYPNPVQPKPVRIRFLRKHFQYLTA